MGTGDQRGILLVQNNSLREHIEFRMWLSSR